MRAFLMSMLRWVLARTDKFFAKYSLVGDPLYFTEEQFPWTKNLEANWKVIREELDAILKYRDDLPNFQEISVDQKGLSNDNLWKTFFFYAYGFKAKKNCQRCPQTTRYLQSIPGMKAAFFSILGPHKHIHSHQGKCKGVIRYHLGLIIPHPNEKCKIRVGDEIRYWQEGKSLIFDDTFNHEVWNETDEYRVVLFVDFVRPLRFPASVVNWIIINLIALSPLVLGAVGNYFAWEKRFQEVIKERDEISAQ